MHQLIVSAKAVQLFTDLRNMQAIPYSPFSMEVKCLDDVNTDKTGVMTSGSTSSKISTVRCISLPCNALCQKLSAAMVPNTKLTILRYCYGKSREQRLQYRRFCWCC